MFNTVLSYFHEVQVKLLSKYLFHLEIVPAVAHRYSILDNQNKMES